MASSPVTLNVRLDAAMVRPGGVLRCTVSMQVLEPIQFASVALDITGTECVSVTGSGAAETHRDNRRFTAYSFHQPLAGNFSPDQGITYKPGEYTFPVSVTLPLNIPPSFYTTIGNRDAYLQYTVTALMKAANGVSTSAESPLFVPHVVGRTQLDELNAKAASTSQASPMYRFSCFGRCCFCSTNSSEGVIADVTMSPPALTFDPSAFTEVANSLAAGGGGAPSPTHRAPRVTLQVRIRNETRRELRHFKAVLLNHICIGTGRNAITTHNQIGELIKFKGDIQANGEALAEGAVVFPTMYRLGKYMAATLPLPEFQTRFVTSMYTVEVVFASRAVHFQPVSGPHVFGACVNNPMILRQPVVYADAIEGDGANSDRGGGRHRTAASETPSMHAPLLR